MTSIDPFFHIPNDRKWNACIGKQGDEENYADGYIQAAKELANLLLEKKMFDKRDTLALPILYNARHAIELTLKLVLSELKKSKIIPSEHRQNHDIKSHLEFLEKHNIPDKCLRDYSSSLGKFVDSLSRIDDDGQELRFHKNRKGQPSIENKTLANIEVIHQSLIELQDILAGIKNRTFALCYEWRTGTRTNKCSRRDLFEIAKTLPKRSNWASQEFSEAKETIKERFHLSNNQFSNALKKIEENRELSGIISIESSLLHLSDEKAKFLIEQWETLHETNNDEKGPRLVSINQIRKEIENFSRRWEDVYPAIIKELDVREFADAQTVYYLARDGEFSEFYEESVKRRVTRMKNVEFYHTEIHELMCKTNFKENFIKGLRTLGRCNFEN
ncbi:hypothetical protein SAMN04488045_2676 [Thalassococcus halodurans]|uniref:HEPN domain-containing protein n=1 Tax=Thalassococcus halodurans TaxID=373675 RepID=A0A1H5ZY31_9RHOB|nr:hypothetical protein [Thalassococcus halodurans]SEG40366.1 hypothetical protein SAMN04488045_2676 [Thalassococcus halodurans]